MEIQDREEFREMREGYMRRFRPADYVERDLVTQLAITSWRLHRLLEAESRLYPRSAEVHLRQIFDRILDTLLKLQHPPNPSPAKEHSLRVA